MDESLTWKDFYGIEVVDGKYKVADINDFCYISTHDTYDEAEETAKKYFEGLKEIWE